MKIAIHLDGSQQYIFYSGQDVSGHVRLETKDEIKIRGIRLEVHGTSHALLIERWGPFRRRYKCTETLMNLKTYITGSDTGSEMTLQPGVQTCPLSFVLPNNLPSSFHGAYGFTRYKMKVVVDRINRLNDSIEIPIIVIRQLNLNNEPPEMKVPIVVQDERPMAGCCVGFCCIKGLPEIELRMNKGCFVIGETIILSGRVFNRSNTEIRMISINFIQDTDYHLTCTDGSKLENHEHRNLGTIKRPQVKVGCTDTWSDVTFTVPPVMASRMDGSEIFSINYFIEVKVNFAKGWCADSSIRQKIIIGHKPLEGENPNSEDG